MRARLPHWKRPRPAVPPLRFPHPNPLRRKARGPGRVHLHEHGMDEGDSGDAMQRTLPVAPNHTALQQRARAPVADHPPWLPCRRWLVWARCVVCRSPRERCRQQQTVCCFPTHAKCCANLQHSTPHEMPLACGRFVQLGQALSAVRALGVQGACACSVRASPDTHTLRWPSPRLRPAPVRRAPRRRRRRALMTATTSGRISRSRRRRSMPRPSRRCGCGGGGAAAAHAGIDGCVYTCVQEFLIATAPGLLSGTVQGFTRVVDLAKVCGSRVRARRSLRRVCFWCCDLPSPLSLCGRTRWPSLRRPLTNVPLPC